MARIRCSGRIVLDGPEGVWLVDEPGDEVRDWRAWKAAPVVPTAWLPAPGWGSLWAHAHRTTRDVRRGRRERADSRQ